MTTSDYICAAILALLTFGVSTGIAPSAARADVIYLCADGSNITVEHATPAVISKLRRSNRCVRDHHRRLEADNRRIVRLRRHFEHFDYRFASATWDLCGEPSCHSVGKRRTRGYYDRSGPMIAVDHY